MSDSQNNYKPHSWSSRPCRIVSRSLLFFGQFNYLNCEISTAALKLGVLELEPPENMDFTLIRDVAEIMLVIITMDALFLDSTCCIELFCVNN